jgi:hypothetical protein
MILYIYLQNSVIIHFKKIVFSQSFKKTRILRNFHICLIYFIDRKPDTDLGFGWYPNIEDNSINFGI